MLTAAPFWTRRPGQHDIAVGVIGVMDQADWSRSESPERGDDHWARDILFPSPMSSGTDGEIEAPRLAKSKDEDRHRGSPPGDRAVRKSRGKKSSRHRDPSTRRGKKQHRKSRGSKDRRRSRTPTRPIAFGLAVRTLTKSASFPENLVMQWLCAWLDKTAGKVESAAIMREVRGILLKNVFMPASTYDTYCKHWVRWKVVGEHVPNAGCRQHA